MAQVERGRSDTSGLAVVLRALGASPWAYESADYERLYSSYTARQKQHAVERLLYVAVVFDVYALLVPGEASLAVAYPLALAALLLNVVLLAAHAQCAGGGRAGVAHAAWLAAWAQVCASAARRAGDAHNEHLGWALLLQYLTCATMPFPFPLLLAYSALTSLGYIASQYFSYSVMYTEPGPLVGDDFVTQQGVNATLLVAVTVLGLLSYALAELQQRRAFTETKNSLEVKLLIEEQSKEQERLLLSVLPEHVAVQMRRDLGLIDTQFKKIYMSRHENVSILYADIVGFTAISSTYSAQDLVAILNELFARFDRLAEKYQQLRIKILGDCYYCISGAPVERPDHAVLCVHMGLSMVKAIKYVQQTTNSPVDMRVGIHTGAVLAGVLGQRQWQFDVYSRDVVLANKMESSGMAGRVHISETTLSFLSDEFEVEPAHGERREEMLRQAGLKTYFIVRVLKPYGGAKGAQNGIDAGDEGAFPDTPSDLKDDDDESVLSPQEENKLNEDLKILEMLDNELVSRDDNKELEEQTSCCLTFTSTELESGYKNREENFTMMFSPPIVVVPFLLKDLASPPNIVRDYFFWFLLGLSAIANVGDYIYCRHVISKKKKVNPKWKLSCGLFNVGIIATANITALSLCAAAEAEPESGAAQCAHPSYFLHAGVLTLLAALFVSPLRVAPHVLLLSALALAHAPPALLPAVARAPPAHPPPFTYHFLFGNETDVYNNDGLVILSALHNGRLLLMLFMIVGALAIFIRYKEARGRARYVRAVRMSSQREQAADMRRRNQALVYNVLPPHVAHHFMGARRRHHRDLYSQSYAEVGVLFASMPNFSEFYSEESVNNQGLECLRFLNEVISDFDALLEQPPFKDIIKIKTIGSTYMAASGLNPARIMQPGDGVTVRWAHLACLVEFALELKRALQGINEQSFNHFVLKMGVNHGPITAGVIGARKPHYDIWGNTVNVASRMESTGKAGCIQVTEETCHILQHFGYYFEQRGLVAVKGKGQLMTYYLQGKGLDPSLSANGATIMETVMEEEAPMCGELDSRADCQSPLLASNGASRSPGCGGGGASQSPRRGPLGDPAAALLPVDSF